MLLLLIVFSCSSYRVKKAGVGADVHEKGEDRSSSRNKGDKQGKVGFCNLTQPNICTCDDVHLSHTGIYKRWGAQTQPELNIQQHNSHNNQPTTNSLNEGMSSLTSQHFQFMRRSRKEKLCCLACSSK